jgi:glutathione S-transferase
MYQLYIGNKNYSSWSLRPWVLLTQLGIGFQETIAPLAPGSSWDAFRKFSPSGKVPCLIDGGITVWDSLAISEYLAERHAGIWPKDAAARAWARCAAAEMHSGFQSLRGQCPMNCSLRVRLRPGHEGLQSDVDRLDELWAEGLSRFGGPYLAGDRFTAVDAFFAPVAFRIQTYGIPVAARSLGYVQRLLGLTAMQAWYAAALHEPWHLPVSDAETIAAGELLEDLRQP